MGEETNEMVARHIAERKERYKIIDAIRNSKLSQISDEMLEQIKAEAQDFEQIDNPTGKQKYEQACRLAVLLSHVNCFVIDFKMDINTVTTVTDDGSITTKTGTLEMWCDTVTLFFSRDLSLWNKLNSLADHLSIVYSEDTFDSRSIIKFVYLIYNV